MRKTQNQYKITAEIIWLAKSLHDIANEVSQLENQITGMSVSSFQSASSVVKNFLPQSGAAAAASCRTEGHRTEGSKTNIIPFPGSGCEIPQTKQLIAKVPYLAAPGCSLPPGIPDCRNVLQRDGLILLGWDKRLTETGERYTAYWVTSAGIPRFYASKPLLLADFPFANPDHKSYAAEDGIEFYGQKAPVYIVHVAPDLMMSNPQHGELRTVHINMLKEMGSEVNFDYKYLLKTGKKHKSDNPSGSQAC
jgi:hypothetical protein